MNTQKKLLLLFILTLNFLATPVLAADREAGAEKASTCLGCHGLTGKSGNAQRPNLAAQQPEYFINQIYAYQKGTRVNAMMQAMSVNLKDEDIENLAAYFASLPPVSSSSEPALAKSGQTKASLCLGCHGPAAEGNGQIPRLAGQHPGYLERQLNYFKTGSRVNSHMQEIAEGLSEADIKELSAYFGSL